MLCSCCQATLPTTDPRRRPVLRGLCEWVTARKSAADAEKEVWIEFDGAYLGLWVVSELGTWKLIALVNGPAGES